jgi:SNF2 family DNA or RNA helicase
VNVIKLVLNDTVEEHILRLAITKIKLDEQIRGGGEDESSEVDQNVLEALRNDMKAEVVD